MLARAGLLSFIIWIIPIVILYYIIKYAVKSAIRELKEAEKK